MLMLARSPRATTADPRRGGSIMITKEKEGPDGIEVIIVEESVRIDPIQTDPNGIRGPNITVTGTAKLITARSDNPNQRVSSPELISEVAVQLGPSGTFVSAAPTGPISSKTHKKTFSTWTTGPRAITGVVNDQLQITARISVEVDGQPEEQPNPDIKTVRVDGSPLLSLATPGPITEAMVDKKATFHLAGAAFPARDGADSVVAVKWALGDGQPFILATPKAPGDWSSWTAEAKVSPAGTYQVTVQAFDGKEHGSLQEKVVLNAVEGFDPKDPSDVFGQAAYLDDLLNFAGKRMVDAQGAPLTRGMLTTAYHHRFD